MKTSPEESMPASAVNLAEVFPRACFAVLPTTLDKPAVLQRLVQTLAEDGRVPAGDVPDLVISLAERERFGSTGLGKGLAFPHLRTQAVSRSVGAVGLAVDGIDFGSLDGLPTRVVLLVLSPVTRREEHFQIMGRLASLLSYKTLQYSVQIPHTKEELFKFLGI